MSFRKKLTKEQFDILVYDLDCIVFKHNENNMYHYNVLKANLCDLAGVDEK